MNEHNATVAEVMSNRINENKRTLITEFSRTVEAKKPKYNDKGNFYVIQSSKTAKTKPCETMMLNLQIKINLPEGIEAGIGLLQTFISRNLTIENFKRFSNKTKDKFIELDLLNRNFHNTITIQKKSRTWIYYINK